MISNTPFTLKCKLFLIRCFKSKKTQEQVLKSAYTFWRDNTEKYHTDRVFLDKKDFMFVNSPEYYCRTSPTGSSIRKYETFSVIKNAIDKSLINNVKSTPGPFLFEVIFSSNESDISHHHWKLFHLLWLRFLCKNINVQSMRMISWKLCFLSSFQRSFLWLSSPLSWSIWTTLSWRRRPRWR